MRDEVFLQKSEITSIATSLLFEKLRLRYQNTHLCSIGLSPYPFWTLFLRSIFKSNGLLYNRIGLSPYYAEVFVGGIVDSIGTAIYGKLEFEKGVVSANNFHQYRMIRHNEAPKAIEIHFVENQIDPTGMGEPAYPPVFAALANALYKATGFIISHLRSKI